MVKIIRTVFVSKSGHGWPERAEETSWVTEMFHVFIWAVVTEMDTFNKIHKTKYSTHRLFICMQIISIFQKFQRCNINLKNLEIFHLPPFFFGQD